MTKEICDGCIVDRDDIHRCRAIETSCQDGIACPDYLGEGNCGCPNPDCKEADMNLDKLVRYGKEVGGLSISDLTLPDWMKGVLEQPKRD